MKSNISELVSYCRRSKKHREFSHTSRKQIRTEGTQTVTFTTKQHRLWTRCKNQAKHRKKALLKKSESKSKWITHFPEFKLMIKGFKNNFLLIFYFRKPEYSGCHKYTASNRSLTQHTVSFSQKTDRGSLWAPGPHHCMCHSENKRKWPCFIITISSKPWAIECYVTVIINDVYKLV